MLLTISIPTYNRDSYLYECLLSLLTQVENFREFITVEVADNCSMDNTVQVVDSVKQKGYTLNYFRHENNLGMDGNFTFLFNNCKTKYLWILSDDDILMPNAIANIIEVLQGQELGNLFLNNIWYHSKKEIPLLKYASQLSTTVYNNPLAFVERVNYWFTFISANIINKSVINGKIDMIRYQGTFLQLLAWNIPVVFQGLPNIVINNPVLLCKGDNTRGYKVFNVFGRNLRAVLVGLVEDGCNPAILTIIDKHLLASFFPMFIGKNTISFGKESYLKVLLPLYWKYAQFWKLVATIQFLNLRRFLKKCFSMVTNKYFWFF